ncbi:TadE family type IV pilus minor pilin [uncultured Schumannella sp.]|uniref:TadE family type IV pilus minor pilin n=1 Tax=uncultured Schumannella sp. TaxID=1195956 RepID=UPI0025D83BED|nr:TadE family type IV pilus minor pilin [uncultured Schumannella sp.]
MRSRWRADRGSVVAEFAIALPAILFVFLALMAGIQLGSAAVRLSDAAADAARGFARGEASSVVAAHLAVQVPGATLARRDDGGLVCAELSLTPSGVGGLLGVRLEARSCALAGGL